MDNNTKKFFEELSQAANEEVPVEPRIEPAKASAVSAKERKASKNDAGLSDFLEEGEGQLAVDVYQAPNDIVVESTIAGVLPDELDIDIAPELVTIRGKRAREKKIEEEDYFYQECYWGKFSRSIILPQEIDPENSTASLKNGVLTIRMPKLNRQKSRKLKVKFD